MKVRAETSERSATPTVRALALAAALAVVASTCAAPNAAGPSRAARPRAEGEATGTQPVVLDADELEFLARPEQERVEAVQRAERALSAVAADDARGGAEERELELALQDDFELRGLSQSGCGLLRVRDLAARALGRRTGVTFRCFWPMYDRDRAAARISNVLRARRGLPARPVPARPTVPRADDDAARQARAALVDASDPARARAALETYVEMGLSGLAPLRAALRALPATHPAHRLAQPVLARLASTIREVRIEDAEAPLSRDARFSVGEVLTPEALRARLRAAYLARPVGAIGVRIERDANGLGVSIVMRSVPVTAGSTAQTPGATRDWARYDAAYFEPLSPSSGFRVTCSGTAPGSEPQTYEPAHLLRTLAWLVKAPPEVAGELRISMSWPTAIPPMTPEQERELRSVGGREPRPVPPPATTREFEAACGAVPAASRFPDDTTLPQVGACPPTPMTWTIPAAEMNRNYGRTVGPGLCYGVVHFGRTGQAVEGCDTFHCSTLRYCDGTERRHYCSILAECRDGVPVATGFSW